MPFRHFLLGIAQSAAASHFFTRYVQQVGSLQLPSAFPVACAGACHPTADPGTVRYDVGKNSQLAHTSGSIPTALL